MEQTTKEWAQWKHPSSPTPKKAKVVKSASKHMIILFFDYEGIVYTNAVEAGKTVNAQSVTKIVEPCAAQTTTFEAEWIQVAP